MEASVTPIAGAKSKGAAKKYTPTTYPEAFEAEWRQTDKTGSKFDALTSWNRLGRPAFGSAWAQWKASEQWQRGFVPHVATWLNDRRFEQEPVDVRAAARPATRQDAQVAAGHRFLDRRQKENA